jgi:site-specific DNA-methyltransferase (cytosine-N4-specific)
MLWLEMDQPTFKRVEIGSHRKYSSKGKRAATVETFRAEMEEVFRGLSQILRPHRHACFVIGDSTIGGEVVDNASLLSAAGQSAGFVEVERLTRPIKATAKAFNPAIGKIKTEKILILENRSI